MSRPWCLAFVVVLGMVAPGCGGKSCPPPVAPTTSSDPAVARIMEHEAATCACTDLACAAAARKDLDRWTEGNQEAMRQAVTDPTREMQLDVHHGRAEACRQELYDAATPEQRLAAGDATDRAVAKFGELTDRVCACKDLACAEHVMKEISEMDEPEGKPTREQMEQVMKYAEQMAACQRRLMGDETPDASTP
jgi:type I site-specific restriction endonuclease